MTADEKTCPDCAENVKSAAKICRFCGHTFAAPDFLQKVAGHAAEATKKKDTNIEREKNMKQQ